ncbi:UNVERIFIED_CONTAM: hypothetical protein FKN15_025755 [Acipenser sinensis]
MAHRRLKHQLTLGKLPLLEPQEDENTFMPGSVPLPSPLSPRNSTALFRRMKLNRSIQEFRKSVSLHYWIG